MKLINRFIILFFTFSSCCSLLFAEAVETSKTEFYGWPAGASKVVTGSFGEFRAYSFHLGTDFSTEGRIGIPILAMANGRLKKIQSNRYSIGNAVLIQQDDGFVSRYGHMNHFSEKIVQAIAKSEIQEKIKLREDFEYEFSSQESISIQKGEIIGYSGQTGIGPPHLHVELFKDDVYYNLDDFLDMKELNNFIKIESILITPENNQSYINGKQNQLELKVSGGDGVFYPSTKSPIQIHGKVSFSISAHESTGRGSRLGLKKIGLFLNEKELQEIDISKIYFPHVNRSCFILDNYKSNIRGRPFKYFTHSREENMLSNFKYTSKGIGIVSHEDLASNINILKLVVYGLNQKKATLSINLVPDPIDPPKVQLAESIFNIDSNVSLDLYSSDLKFRSFFPKGSVFTKAFMSAFENPNISVKQEGILQLSQVYSVRPDYREFDSGYEVTLQVDKDMNLFPEKTGVYMVSEKGGIIRYLSHFEYDSKNGIYKGKQKISGNYVILEDNIKPWVKVQRWKNKQTLEAGSKIFLSSGDIGSGVGGKSIEASVDGKPILLDYDPDLGIWEVFGPEFVYDKGEHLLEAIAKDRAGNLSEKLEFTYFINSK